MARQSLVDMAVGRILDDVITGAFPPGESLPPESDLAARTWTLLTTALGVAGFLAVAAIWSVVGIGG